MHLGETHIHNLKTLEKEDYSIFQEYLEKSDSNRTWGTYFPILHSNGKNVQWIISNESLCVYQKDTYSTEEETEKTWSMAFPPVPFNTDAIEESFEILDKLNGKKQKKYGINNIDGNRALINTINNYKIEYIPDGAEYFYDVKKSKKLEGPAFKNIRNHISRFEHKFHPRIEEYSSNMYEECLELFDVWKQRKIKNGNGVLYKEHIEEMFRELRMFPDMFGVAVLVDDKLRAFSIGGHLSKKHNTATCIIRKTSPDMPGLSEYIDRKFYDCLPESITLVNDGDDCNDPDLANYKKKWQPIEVRPIFKANIEKI